MIADDLIAGVGSAAKEVGVTEPAMFHLVYSGRVPFVKLGRRYYFRRSELEQTFSTSSPDQAA